MVWPFSLCVQRSHFLRASLSFLPVIRSFRSIHSNIFKQYFPENASRTHISKSEVFILQEQLNLPLSAWLHWPPLRFPASNPGHYLPPQAEPSTTLHVGAASLCPYWVCPLRFAGQDLLCGIPQRYQRQCLCNVESSSTMLYGVGFLPGIAHSLNKYLWSVHHVPCTALSVWAKNRRVNNNNKKSLPSRSLYSGMGEESGQVNGRVYTPWRK